MDLVYLARNGSQIPKYRSMVNAVIDSDEVFIAKYGVNEKNIHPK